MNQFRFASAKWLLIVILLSACKGKSNNSKDLLLKKWKMTAITAPMPDSMKNEYLSKSVLEFKKDGNYSITGAAGTYQASNTFTGLTPGTYNPAVRDANNCIVTAAATTLTQPAAIVVSGTVPQLTFNVAMTPVTFTKTNGAGSPANPWSVSSGTLPTNLTLNTATGM